MSRIISVPSKQGVAMKSKLYLILILFSSTTLIYGQTYGLKNLNKSLFDKYRVPELKYRSFLLDGNLYFSSITNEYYENTSLGMTLKQTIVRKFTLSAGFTYSYSDYNLPVVNPREDDNYGGSLDFEYQIQDWLSTGIAYDYSRKDSNYIANDYTVNQYMIFLKAEY